MLSMVLLLLNSIKGDSVEFFLNHASSCFGFAMTDISLVYYCNLQAQQCASRNKLQPLYMGPSYSVVFLHLCVSSSAASLEPLSFFFSDSQKEGRQSACSPQYAPRAQVLRHFNRVFIFAIMHRNFLIPIDWQISYLQKTPNFPLIQSTQQ